MTKELEDKISKLEKSLGTEKNYASHLKQQIEELNNEVHKFKHENGLLKFNIRSLKEEIEQLRKR